MIHFIHGTDYPKVYQRLGELTWDYKNKDYEIIEIDKNLIDFEIKIKQKNLFNEKRLLIIHTKKINKNQTLLLNERSKADEIIINFHEELGSTFIKSLQNIGLNERYNLPKLLWTFLDSLYPGNIKNVFALLNNLVKLEPLELIFLLISQRMRDLYWVSVDSLDIKYDKWRINKLLAQSKKFNKEIIENIVYDLSKSDIKCKTTDFDLKDELDLMLVKYLQ